MATTMYNANVVGRKQHRCDLCGLEILPGVKHRLAKVKDGGEFYEFRYHPICDRVTVLDRWDDIDWESGTDPADFRVRLAELVSDGKITTEPEEPDNE